MLSVAHPFLLWPSARPSLFTKSRPRRRLCGVGNTEKDISEPEIRGGIYSRAGNCRQQTRAVTGGAVDTEDGCPGSPPRLRGGRSLVICKTGQAEGPLERRLLRPVSPESQPQMLCVWKQTHELRLFCGVCFLESSLKSLAEHELFALGIISLSLSLSLFCLRAF